MNVPLTGRVCAVVSSMHPHRNTAAKDRIFMILFMSVIIFPTNLQFFPD